MSIYIKDIEMPKSCFYCPMRMKVDPDNIKCLVTGEVFEETFTATIEMRHAGKCPLVPIPPHGRLIDADALKELFRRAEAEKDYTACSIEQILDTLNEVPTVIPDEEDAERM